MSFENHIESGNGWIPRSSSVSGVPNPVAIAQYIDPATNKPVNHIQIIDGAGVVLSQTYKYPDGTPYIGLVTALVPEVQTEIETQVYKDPATKKPVLAVTKYEPNGSITTGYPTYKFLDGTTFPGQPASIANLRFPADNYSVTTEYWVDIVPVANTLKIKYVVLKDGVIDPLANFVTLIDGTTTTLSVNAKPYDNQKVTAQYFYAVDTGIDEQLMLIESTDKVTGVLTRTFYKDNGAIATPANWRYGNISPDNTAITTLLTQINNKIATETTLQDINSKLIPSANGIRVKAGIFDSSGNQIDNFGVVINNPNASVQATVTTGGVAQTILGANASRRGFEIQNNSSLDIRVAFGATASATVGFIIKANEGSYSSQNFVSTSAISIFGTTTGQAFTFIEY